MTACEHGRPVDEEGRGCIWCLVAAATAQARLVAEECGVAVSAPDDAVLAGILRRLLGEGGGNGYSLFAPTPMSGRRPFLVVDAEVTLVVAEVEALARLAPTQL